MIFEPYKQQKEVLLSNSRFTLFSGGAQVGKTVLGAVWMQVLITKNNFEGDYLICAPSYKILQQSTLPKFFELIPSVSSWGRYHKADEVFKLKGGKGRIFFRSADTPNSLEGMTLKGCWLDEAGGMGREVWIIVSAGRTSFYRAPILLTTTPYLNCMWIEEEIIKHAQKNDPDYKVVYSTAEDNPFYPKAEIERARRTMRPEDFAMRFLGQWCRLQGLVYPDFNNDTHLISNFIPTEDMVYFCGVDFGQTNPSCLLLIAKNRQGEYFIIDEFYKSNVHPSELAKLIKGNKVFEHFPNMPIKTYYCDPSATPYINEMLYCGINDIENAVNDFQEGRMKVTELFKTNKIKIVADNCPNLVSEIKFYKFKDNGIDPVKKDDHAPDALRYGVASTMVENTSVEILSEDMQGNPNRISVEKFLESLPEWAKPKEQAWEGVYQCHS